MPYFTGLSGDVYYRAWRSPDPVAVVVLLHGFGEHSGMYHRLGNTLNQSRVDLWALDEIGHGLTYGERGHVDGLVALVEHADRLLQLASDATPDVPVYVLGHSMGSAVAAALVATRRPGIAGLVLSATPVGPAMVAEAAEVPADLMLSLDAEGCSTDPFYLDELVNDPLAFLGAPFGASIGAVVPAARHALDEEPLPAEVPVLLLHGQQDPVISVNDARALVAEWPHARLVEFDVRHDVLNDVRHREVAATIVEFIRGTANIAELTKVPTASAAR